MSVQRTGGQITVEEASETLMGMLASLGSKHRFVPDDQPAQDFPKWCQSASRTTDAHLRKLAAAHHASLATLDNGIPDAFLIPA